MKHTWKVALAVAVIAGSAGVARADLTLDGQTGLFINPTAEVAKQDSGEIQADYQHIGSDYGSVNVYGVGGAYGIADKLEISGNYNYLKVSGGGSGHANDWRAGGKYQLLSQHDKGFDLAVGGNYERISQGGGSSLNHYNGYVAATKGFGYSESRAPIQATLGVRWDHYSASGMSTSRASVYAGAAVPLSSDGQFSLIGEVGSKTIDGAKTPYAVGLRYHPKSSQFSIGAGFGRPNIFSQESGANTTWFAQIGYNFGK